MDVTDMSSSRSNGTPQDVPDGTSSPKGARRDRIERIVAFLLFLAIGGTVFGWHMWNAVRHPSLSSGTVISKEFREENLGNSDSLAYGDGSERALSQKDSVSRRNRDTTADIDLAPFVIVIQSDDGISTTRIAVPAWMYKDINVGDRFDYDQAKQSVASRQLEESGEAKNSSDEQP